MQDLAKHKNHLTTGTGKREGKRRSCKHSRLCGGYFVSVGIIGTKYLLEALTAYGRADLALQLAENTDYPSWGYMIHNPIEPATTYAAPRGCHRPDCLVLTRVL